MKKIAEGELLVHTQKSAKNVDSLRSYLASLRAESQKTSVGLDSLAKSLFLANARGASLGKVFKGLASAAGFGGAGAAAYLVVDRLVGSLVEAKDNSDKLTESLSKAVGERAADSIEGTTSKMGSLTKVINEAKTAISSQTMVDRATNSVAAFFFNDDADRAVKAFEKAVETRIALGDKLVAQEFLRVAQQKLLMKLEDDSAEAFKINIETRSKLTKIEADESLTSQQKKMMSELAKEEESDKLRAIRLKKEKETDKKIAEEKKKSDEDSARVAIQITDSLIKQEEALFDKGARDFKDAQDEKVKAAEEANRQISESSRKAVQRIGQQDAQAQKDFEEKTGADVSILGATRGGQMALEQARKSRKIQVSKQDFRTQEAILSSERDRLSRIEGKPLTMQDVRVRMATRVAATEMPTLGEKLAGTAAGIEPAQVARSRAEEAMTGNKQGLPNIMKSIETILNKLASAPLVTSGSGGQ